MEALTQAWLDLQCKMIAGVSQGVVVLSASDNTLSPPATFWPLGTSGTPGLKAVAEKAMVERRGVVHDQAATAEAGGASLDAVAYPFLIDDKVFGVVAVEVAGRPEPQLRSVVQLLQWGVAWLEVLVREEMAAKKDGLVTVVELVATALEQERFHAAATAVVTELATRLGCERVSLGFSKGRQVKVRALSHSAQFGGKSNLIRDIGAAMEEALDQQATVVFPAPADAAAQLTRAHALLAEQHEATTVCTVPISAHGRMLGAFTLERVGDQGFAPETVTLCEQMASIVGPMLEAKRKEDRALVLKAWDAGRSVLADLFGPRHPALKLTVLAILGLVAFFTTATGEYRVAADAALEGAVQRVAVAPIDGYIETAEARAGDIVRAGQVLSTLEDKDLKLERLKWSSQKQQLLKEYRSALASRDRAQVSILNAQIAQADAQLALVDEQLSRTQIIAPFNGVIVNGDLSQALGSPVERGQVLFEVAPLNAYRVILKVDERDVSELALGQHGRLALTAVHGKTLPFVVEKITPVSVIEDGRNLFRVEAKLQELPELLRPGMEGVGKIAVDERKLFWIWTHKLADWLRLFVWSWWP